MARQLTKDVGRTIFGTAVAGYGFAIGRDAWRKTKSNAVPLIVIAVIGYGFLYRF